MINKNTIFKLLALLYLTVQSANAQEILDNYIAEGLKNNIVLQQKNIELEKALISLKEANSLFLPSINFNGLVSTAKGGRYSNLPVGDLLNPVYRTLNQLTNSSNYPTIANQQIDFLPKDYYDAYFRASLPLINADLLYNRKIESQKIQLQEFEVAIYQRELVKNIKTAYYNYLTANEAVKIYSSAIELLNRNVSVNKSLLNNGKGLPTAILRSQSELENVNAQLNDANNQLQNAQSYFNFLLNKEQNLSITEDENIINEASNPLLDSAQNFNAKREELQMLDQVKNINNTVNEMNKRYWVPKINAFLDLGSQAVNWEFSNKSRYYMVGLNATFPVFNGFRNNYKIKKSTLDTKISEFNLKNTANQLQLAASIATNNLNTAYQNRNSSLQRLKSAESYFKLIENGYNGGVNSLIEFIDARNQLTLSKLQVNINSFKVLVAKADVERELASYKIK